MIMEMVGVDWVSLIATKLEDHATDWITFDFQWPIKQCGIFHQVENQHQYPRNPLESEKTHS